MGDVYHVALRQGVTLAEAESAIRAEEADGSEFRGCQLNLFNDSVVNMLEFAVLDDEGVPDPLVLVAAGGPAPPGRSKVWEGTMAVDNTVGEYCGYR
jgi:hypothetical protein